MFGATNNQTEDADRRLKSPQKTHCDYYLKMNIRYLTVSVNLLEKNILEATRVFMAIITKFP